MNTASEVLVIIVSAVLAIFLVILIFVLIQVYKILRHVRRITAQAQNVADSVEAAASAFERTASPLAVLKVVANIVDQVTRSKRRK